MDEIHYLLGNSCDLNCDFCFWDMKLSDISLLQKKRIVDEIKSIGIKKLTISGGEPTCNSDLLEILEYCRKNGFEVILHTHGLRLNKSIVQKLSSLVSRVSLALDGSNKEMNHRMRKNVKILSHTLFLINLLDSFGIAVNVKTLVTKINKDDVLNIGKLLSDKPIKYWSLLEFNPINRGRTHKDRFFLSAKEFDTIARVTKKVFPKLPIKVRKFRSEPQHYCFIASDGQVYTYISGKGDMLIGDLLKKSLVSILKDII